MKPNWEDAPDWANWLAMDSDGQWFWHECKPFKSCCAWSSNGQVDHAGWLSIEWHETLDSRP